VFGTSHGWNFPEQFSVAEYRNWLAKVFTFFLSSGVYTRSSAPGGECTQIGVVLVTIQGRHIYIREEGCIRFYREVASLYIVVSYLSLTQLRRTINWDFFG